MYGKALAAILATVCLSGVAAAAAVDMDFVVVTSDGAAVFGDVFDDVALDTPPWIVVGGTPGPEAGGNLTLANGAAIATALGTDPTLVTGVQSSFTTSGFGATDFINISFLDQQGVQAGVIIGDGFAFAFDSFNSPLGTFVAVPTGAVSLDMGLLGNNGNLTVNVNGTEVYNGGVSFGTVAALQIAVTPEPASFILLALSGLLIRRRR